MLTQFLDWLDEAAGGLIRLAYLAAGVTAVAVYFGAGQLPAWLDHPLNATLPWALAFALETHTYLSARRVRAAWQDHDSRAMKVNTGVLIVLLAFSAWNQLGYLDGVWTPPQTGPLALPIWLAYGVRALIVPSAFMAAAFLAPLAPPIVAQIEGEARATLADVFTIARRQRKRMLKEAERSGRDLTGALVELVPDDETRRIIGHAYAAIRSPDPSASAFAPVEETFRTTLVSKSASSAPQVQIPTDEPPDGPGGPVSPDTKSEPSAQAGNGLIPLFTSRETARPRTMPSAGRSGAKSAAIRRRDRDARDALDARRRQRAWAMLDSDPATSAAAIARALHCRHRTAASYRAAWERRRADRSAPQPASQIS